MHGEKYTAYTKDLDAEQVAARFERKHGRPPAEVLDAGAVWLAGPLVQPRSPQVNRPSLVRRVASEKRMTPAQARQLALSLEVRQ